MSMIFSLVLAAGTAHLSPQYQREWQSCISDTSKLWASKPGPPEVIVDAATIYCRDKFELFMIVQMDKTKAIGLNEGQASEYNAFLAGALLRLNRSFAIEVVESARRK